MPSVLAFQQAAQELEAESLLTCREPEPLGLTACWAAKWAEGTAEGLLTRSFPEVDRGAACRAPMPSSVRLSCLCSLKVPLDCCCI